ncbi:hypothetical protein C8J57DRAFT_1714213 [Mycena rebaudengoi]|nr:hypothetical protein C8J57DRAFT_1714213 [Mycena rebaudengoi]
MPSPNTLVLVHLHALRPSSSLVSYIARIDPRAASSFCCAFVAILILIPALSSTRTSAKFSMNEPSPLLLSLSVQLRYQTHRQHISAQVRGDVAPAASCQGCAGDISQARGCLRALCAVRAFQRQVHLRPSGGTLLPDIDIIFKR